MQILPTQTQNSNKVFVWIETLLASNLQVSSYLSHAEKERAAKYKTRQLQDRFVAARGRLREILGEHLGIGPDCIEFSYNAFGKPSLHPKHNSPLHFNLSHSQDRLAITLTESGPIGIDIERHSHVGDLGDLIFSEQERKLFNDLPETEKTEQFFRAWTLKEAHVKALGSGLNIDIRTIEVLLPTFSEELFVDSWTLRTLPVERGWACAIAVQTKNPRVISCNNRDNSVPCLHVFGNRL